jgi:hypothetical protein
MEPTGIWIDETTDVSRSFTTTSASASAISNAHGALDETHLGFRLSDKVECRLDINNRRFLFFYKN